MNPASQPPLARGDAERAVHEAVESGRLPEPLAQGLGASLRDAGVREAVLEGASESKRRGKGARVTVSRNVFIPLTNLCRDRCSYCTFAKPPDSPEARTYGLDEVAEVVRGGVRTGCTEALFCLGDKPEIAYRSHREWLRERGHRSTADYLVEACRVGFEGGMLPHTNAGILSIEEMARLRGKGMAHQYAPDKEPAVRIRMHEEAGELRIPFTSGILLGIGENEAERVDTLLAIRALNDRFGHVQECIVQPFHPKPGTRMRYVAALPDEEIAAWIGLARLVLGPEMNLQAPPNLAPEVLERLLRAGVNDWGGVSPVTVDFINPEAPWPTLAELRRRTEAAGQKLVERLPVYPEHLAQPDFFEPRVREAALRMADEHGYARVQHSQEAA